MKKISRWIMVLGILVLLIPFVPNSIVNAQTSDYMLSSVAGEWTAVNEGTGVGTSVVKWGTGIWETDYKQSGLEFVGRTNESFNEGEIFPLGTLTHMNWPVQPPFATAATLQITLDFASPNITPSPTFSFDLTIEETTNEYSWRHCHSGFQQTHTPCDDRIQFPASFGTETFTIGDKLYTLEIIGFVVDYPTGDTVDDFITEERKDNTAVLVGKLSSVLVQEPDVTITKKTNDIDVANASEAPDLIVGESVTWQYIVQNSGNVQLTGISVTDNKIGSISCPKTALTPGEVMTCTATGTVLAGNYSNKATVNANYPGGSVTDNDRSWYHGVNAGIELTKTADPAIFVSVGEEIEYTLAAKNTGDVQLTGVTIEDPMIGTSSLNCTPSQPATLNPGETMTCTGTYTTTMADVTAGKVENEATASGNPPSGSPVEDTDDETVTKINPEIELTKTANPSPFSAVEDVITYTFVAKNTGDVTLTNVEITDPMTGLYDWYCNPTGSVSLAPDATLTCTAKYKITQGDIDAGKVENTATAKGKDPLDNVVQDTDGETVDGPAADPEITLTKTPDKATFSGSGETITYDFVAKNTGNVTLTNVTITDPLSGLSALVCDPTGTVNLAPGDELKCTATYTTDQADINAGKVENTATAKGKDPSGSDVQDTDNATVNGPTINAEITLTKTPDKTTFSGSSETITYEFVAENTGNVTLTNVTITDPLSGLSALVCDPTGTVNLAPGDELKCTATYTTDQGDIDAGKVENTATAKGKDPSGSDVQDTDNATVNGPTINAEITLTKTPDKTTFSGSSETITYEFVAENTGNVTLTNVTITDPLSGLSALVCDPTGTVNLAPGDELKCTATYTTDQGDIDAGKVENTATAKGKDPSGSDVQDTDDATVNGPAADPEITLTKTPNKTSYSTIGEVVVYTFVAENTGNVTLTNVTITDPLSGLSALVCDPTGTVNLAPGAKLTCTATYTIDQGDIDAGKVENTATAKGKDPSNNDITDTDDATVNGPAADPAITLAKTPDKTAFSASGETITYEFVAKNTGNVTLTNVTITDPLSGLSALVCNPTGTVNLAPGAELKCTATYTTGQGDIDAGKVENTATAKGTPPSGSDIQDSDDAVVTGPQTSAAISLTKTPDKTTYSASGDVITYTFVATNTGDVTLSNVVIADPLSGLSALSCDLTAPVSLVPGQSLTCTATYTIDQDDIDAGKVENTATATGYPLSGDPVQDSADVDVVGDDINAGIQLTKTADPEIFAAIDDVITYTFVAENTGDVTLSNVEISDPLTGLYDWNCDLADPVTLAPGATLTCTAKYKVIQADIDRGYIENTATAAGDDPSEVEVSDDDDAVVEGPKDGASIRLVKVADPLAFSEVGDEITYTLVAVNNGIYTLTDVTIEDPLVDPTSMSCEPAQPATLLPGESITCTAVYAITQADVDRGYVMNSATATGTGSNEEEVSDEDDAEVEGPKDDASIKLEKTANPSSYKKVGDEITYTFVVTNNGIYTLTDVVISDPLFGITFGPIDALEPGESETFKYTYTITQADIDAKEVKNVATATAKDPEENTITTTDDETITGPEPTKPNVAPKELPTTGFAPNMVTALPVQPETKAYAPYSDFWLEIPKLGVKVDIVGVPMSEEGWDVSWLGNQVGWLNGTAFPTWPGNSTITGHVWDALDQAGPFVDLNQLAYGDQIIIHLDDSEYIFEIRSKHVVLPENMSIVNQTEDYSWLNLVTCKGFNEDREEYLYRLIVRAILVDVQ